MSKNSSSLNKNYGGYEHKIFVKPVNMDLICAICSLVVRKPKECTVCGSLFCESCISLWSAKNNVKNLISECPLRCKKSNDLKESIFKGVGKIIRNLLLKLEVKCLNSQCEKQMTLEEYENHEYICGLPKCNNIICNIGSEKLVEFEIDSVNYKFCDLMCKISYIFQMKFNNLNNNKNNTNNYLISDNNNNKNININNNDNDIDNNNINNNNNNNNIDDNINFNKIDIEEIKKWFNDLLFQLQDTKFHLNCEKKISNLKTMIKAISGSNLLINDLDYSPGITQFIWDNLKKGQGIQVFNNGESLLLNETCYAFRTIVSNTSFSSGVHYWEISADRRTENELKIGITKNINFNYDTSFSDYNFGWAFYGVGQLRHGNNATGNIYGKKFKKSGTLGVFLDMNRGILSFAIDGEYFGIGFQSDELKSGPIWAAVSLLHVGGCVLQTGLPAPLYFFTDY